MRVLLHTLLIGLGASALWCGSLFVVYPDGSAIGSPLSLLDRTPFADFFWPGVILAGLFGVGSLSASFAIGRNWRHGYRAAQVIGAGQVIWILFQVHWFPEPSWLHVLFGMIGLSIVALAERCRRAVLA